MTPLFTCSIPGRVIVKKNTQRIVGSGSRKRAIYSPKFIAWERIAMLHMKRTWAGREPITDPLEVRYRFFFANRQGEADTSNLVEGVSDALQKSGVIEDDKLIHILHASKSFGGEARVEIEIARIDEENQSTVGLIPTSSGEKK